MLDLFSVSVVLVRSLAILIIVQALATIPSALLFLTREPYPEGSSSSRDFSVAFSLVSYLVLAALLLAFAKKLGALITRGLESTSIQIDEGNLRILQRVVFSVLGAYLLVYSVPMLLKMIAIAVLPPIRDNDEGLFRSVIRAQIPLEEAIRICAEVALGLWLLLGGGRIVSFQYGRFGRSPSRLIATSESAELEPIRFQQRGINETEAILLEDSFCTAARADPQLARVGSVTAELSQFPCDAKYHEACRP